MRRALLGLAVAVVWTVPAQAHSLTFPQTRTVLSGLAKADGSTTWKVRSCSRRSRQRIDCTLDEFGVYVGWLDDGARADITGAPLSVVRKGQWGVIVDRDPGFVTDYRKRL